MNHRVLFGLDYLWMNNNQGLGFGGVNDITPLYLLMPNLPMHAIMPAISSTTDITTNQLGLYASDQMKFGDGWHFNIGVRQDFASQDNTNSYSIIGQSRDDDAFTWQTGLLYRSQRRCTLRELRDVLPAVLQCRYFRQPSRAVLRRAV